MTKGSQEAAGASADENSGSRATPPPGAAAAQANQQPRVVSRPEDVAGLVLMQIDLVNARKDDLTHCHQGIVGSHAAARARLWREHADHRSAAVEVEEVGCSEPRQQLPIVERQTQSLRR